VRIVYVAGFFKHILPELQARQRENLESGAVVWIPPYKNATPEPNLNRFKGSFLDSINRGATEILICLFVMRSDNYVLPSVHAIVEEGIRRNPKITVEIKTFRSARDADGVVKLIKDFNPTLAMEYPTDLGVLEKWITEHHSDRIILHPRAINAAKKSRFEDVSLIYAAVDFLGIEYWTSRTAIPDQAADIRCQSDLKLRELKLDLAPSISATAAGKEGDEYIVTYPQGTNEKRLLDQHISKGSARDERFCLRIYFFWDEELKKVVIGWLPSHLDTQNT
jgi:hypothetical protein